MVDIVVVAAASVLRYSTWEMSQTPLLLKSIFERTKNRT